MLNPDDATMLTLNDGQQQGRDKPYGILYAKGASVIRALGALIGDQALRAGLGTYLRRFGPGSATLDDLIECWSQASGRELAGWGDQWLRTEGVPTIWLDEQGMVRQDMPRWQRVGVGLFDLDDGRLRRRELVTAELEGERTPVPELAAADAVVLNDHDLCYTRARFDDRSARVLADVACQVGDPLAEAVCWNGFWLLVTSGEVPASQFADMACRRLAAGGLPRSGAEAVLARAVEAADMWAEPALRPGLREQVADAAWRAISAAGTAAIKRALAVGVATSAQAGRQLALLGSWLAGEDVPDGLRVDADLRARILCALAARGQARDSDIDALPALDPVTGEVNQAMGLAMRPTTAAKEAAWAAALRPQTPARIAVGYATGLWVAGQEELMADYRDRYFSEAVPQLAGRNRRMAQRLSRLLFPSILVSEETIEASSAYADTSVTGTQVADQVTIMRRRLAARTRA
jgi:aminopeptidase N